MTTAQNDRDFFEKETLGLLDDLYGTALRLAKSRHDAEDLVAEAIAKGWSAFSALKERERFRPWLFRILTNTFISHCRKRDGKEKEVSLEAGEGDEASFSLFEEIHQPFLLWWGSPEKEFLNKLLRGDIERAIDSLPEAFRLAVVLSDLEGFSYQEIARILRLPIGTVRSRLARGRGLLQKALWAHAEEAGLVDRKRPREAK